ncbi:MAG TPA: alpha-galactosidase [Chthoniobacterales bacterium]
MPIEYLPDISTFFVHTESATYAMKVLPQGYLLHLYWGARVASQDLDFVLQFRHRSFSPNPNGLGLDFSLDTLPHEYPLYGTGDFRSPAMEVFQPEDGSRIVDLRFKDHQILPGKPALPGLPATWVAAPAEAETLIIGLEDAKLGLRVELTYTAFANHSAITRSTKIIHRGTSPVSIRRILSCSVDFPSNDTDGEFLHLSGAHVRERELFRAPLHPGVQSIESRRGSSSHQHHPFIALTRPETTEDQGEVYGFSLVYSGNFIGLVERDADYGCRLQLGINPFDFSWKLEPGAEFQTPEAVLVFSDEGLGGMSRIYHRLYRTRLCRGEWQDKPRPILVNNWEATYFDFDATKLEKIADAAAGLGIELFVLDDGWFGRRDDDTTSLGDWFVDKRKLPGGLEDLAARIIAKGLTFGLWFEPEMISVKSELYREHPDWCLHVPARPRTEGRNQLILDFSRQDVRDEIYRQMATILRTVPISYVKWDMNRHMTEVGSAVTSAEGQQETVHRYILGLYDFMEKLTSEFPHILFEGCAGGGGRFDPGILYYMPQIWTSDNTDAISRLRIQYGTSVVYPWSTISAHVSVVPNHQVGRVTPFKTRGDVAFTGAFGYELDLSLLSDDDREEVKRQTALYKQLRPLLLRGDLYRLCNPFESNEAAWIVVSPSKDEALVTHVNTLALPNASQRFLRLKGLDPAAKYQVGDLTCSGDVLMNVGLPIPYPPGDFFSCQWHLTKLP